MAVALQLTRLELVQWVVASLQELQFPGGRAIIGRVTVIGLVLARHCLPVDFVARDLLQRHPVVAQPRVAQTKHRGIEEFRHRMDQPLARHAATLHVRAAIVHDHVQEAFIATAAELDGPPTLGLSHAVLRRLNFSLSLGSRFPFYGRYQLPRTGVAAVDLVVAKVTAAKETRARFDAGRVMEVVQVSDATATYQVPVVFFDEGPVTTKVVQVVSVESLRLKYTET